MDLTPQQQRESSAQVQKFARENTLKSLNLPKRKKGELARLSRISDAAHELCTLYYDAAEDDGLSSHYGQVFESAVERMRQLLTPPAPVPSDPPSAPSEG